MSILRYGILSQVTEEPSLEVLPTTISASTSGGGYSFDISSNVGWEVDERTAYTWIELDTTQGIGNDTIGVAVGSNTGSARTGYLDVTSIGLPTQTVTVNQAACITPSASVFVGEQDIGNWTMSGESASISRGSATLSYTFIPSGLSSSPETLYISVSGSQSAFDTTTGANGVRTTDSITLSSAAGCGDNYYISITETLPM